MENYPVVTYRDLLRGESVLFARRHLAVSSDKAYNLKYRRNTNRQSIFIASLDTEFYILPNGYIISSQPLVKIDIIDEPWRRDIEHKKRWGTYCIWRNDHYAHHLWECFNFHQNWPGDPLPERVMKMARCCGNDGNYARQGYHPTYGRN